MPPSTIRRPGVAFIHFTRVCYPRTSAIPMHPLGLASGAPFGRCERTGKTTKREKKREREGEKVAAINDQRSFGTLASRCEFIPTPRQHARERWPRAFLFPLPFHLNFNV